METFNVTKVSILIFDRSTGFNRPFTGIFWPTFILQYKKYEEGDCPIPAGGAFPV